METDRKMSVETAEKTIDIAAMDSKDSSPELASKPVIDSRKISEIYVDIEKKLHLASEEMTRDINKVSEILLEFQKELSMPVESSVTSEEPVEISELLMEMDKNMSHNTNVTSEIQVSVSPVSTKQSVSETEIIAMSAERVSSSPSEMVSVEINCTSADPNPDSFTVPISAPVITELIHDDNDVDDDNDSNVEEIIEHYDSNKPVEESSTSNNAESNVPEVVEQPEESETTEVVESVKEESDTVEDSIEKTKDGTDNVEDETDAKPVESEAVPAMCSVGTETDRGAIADPQPEVQPKHVPEPEAAETPEPEAAETPEPEQSIQTNGIQDTETQTTKQKKKKIKELDHISRAMMKTLNGLDSPDEKINALCKKYADLTAEHRLLTNKFKVQQKQYVQLQREKDHLQSEHSKAVLAKSKLESLCRELQRHNKVVKDESVQRARDEEEKRKELCTKFQQTINDITNQMQDNHAKNIKLKEENVELASKLKSLVEQYERREEHIEKMFKHKELELQLSDAKLQESGLSLAQEKERNLREKTVILSEAADYQRKCEVLQAQEVQLKGQLAIYTEKFEEFQGTLTKSNEVFQQFKQEMDKMTKKIKKLEKETCTWRNRWEVCNRSLVEMTEEKTIRDREMQAQSVKIQRLEKLCRALQAERNALSGKTKPGSRSASSSPTPTPPPADQLAPSSDQPDPPSDQLAPSSDQPDPPSDQSAPSSDQPDPPSSDKETPDKQPISSEDRGPPEGASSPTETIKTPAGDEAVQSDEKSTTESKTEDKFPDP